ncbi:hypothetical protein ASZ78_005954 [Callipepla squamata]|uniref:DBF4-type domain-containing protein n=1 Tax=Callipepla squamata TaxID=9009 RepID=A0A226N9Y6_CALSU|nr:hypothetical protein ASZ78_005954 [Callipepla squamata]
MASHDPGVARKDLLGRDGGVIPSNDFCVVAGAMDTMFDRIKPSDEASASSAQVYIQEGKNILGLEYPPCKTDKDTATAATYTTVIWNSLFYVHIEVVHNFGLLNVILACGLYQYSFSISHGENIDYALRPSYDDMPLPVTPEPARIASSGVVEKKKNRNGQVTSSKDQESIDVTYSSTPYQSHEHTEETSVTQTLSQKLETEKERVAGTSQMSMGNFSNEKCSVLKDAQFANHSREGQSLLKRDGLQTQDETLVSDFRLRDTVGISSSLGLGPSPPLARCKNVKMNRGDASSVDETIENVILKYCHGTAYEELHFQEKNNLCSTFSSLLDHTHLEGSEMSFDCDAPIQSGTDLPKAAIKDIELLKEVQISLQDKNYGTQLSSVLKSESVKQIETVKQNVAVHPEEAVLPALPHVPPSFVGKTWSQIMYEDDIKIEELVRDFREGRFRCYFDSESSANCTGKRMKRKKQKDEKRNNTAEGNRTETASVKALPEFNDALSGGSDFDNPSLASDTLCNPQIHRTPRKRTWRLASRCQVVKVSHGTQTSLLNYPVTKRKMTRRESDPSDQKASVIWPENEKTPNMKTRLCALKLPESYSKIMSPVQPKTVVYVLSCPEMKQCKGKPVDIPKTRTNRNSTDSKDSISQHLKKGREQKEAIDKAIEVLELQKVQSQSNVKQLIDKIRRLI